MADAEASGGTTILVVDDEPSIRLLCRVNLELEGYTILEASNVGEAHELIRTHDVDVVLLDVHIGAEDGVALARELVAERPDLPIALLSGTAESHEVEGEVAPLIRKPFTLDELIGTVRRLAAGAPSQRRSQ